MSQKQWVEWNLRSVMSPRLNSIRRRRASLINHNSSDSRVCVPFVLFIKHNLKQKQTRWLIADIIWCAKRRRRKRRREMSSSAPDTAAILASSSSLLSFRSRTVMRCLRSQSCSLRSDDHEDTRGFNIFKTFQHRLAHGFSHPERHEKTFLLFVPIGAIFRFGFFPYGLKGVSSEFRRQLRICFQHDGDFLSSRCVTAPEVFFFASLSTRDIQEKRARGFFWRNPRHRGSVVRSSRVQVGERERERKEVKNNLFSPALNPYCDWSFLRNKLRAFCRRRVCRFSFAFISLDRHFELREQTFFFRNGVKRPEIEVAPIKPFSPLTPTTD